MDSTNLESFTLLDNFGGSKRQSKQQSVFERRESLETICKNLYIRRRKALFILKKKLEDTERHMEI